VLFDRVAKAAGDAIDCALEAWVAERLHQRVALTIVGFAVTFAIARVATKLCGAMP
jgi:hypothetical protein